MTDSKKKSKLSEKTAFEQKKKEPGLKFNPGFPPSTLEQLAGPWPGNQ